MELEALLTKSWFQRLIAFSVALTFFFTNVFLPVPSAWAEVNVLSSETSPQLQIPFELGTIEEVFAPQTVSRKLRGSAKPGTQRSAAPFIIHIQTAHGSPEVQKKIEALLNYVREKYGVEIFLVEGTEGPLEPELDRYFHNAKWNRQVLEYRAGEGQTSGVSLFLLDQPASVQAIGIEAADAYRKNRFSFQEVFRLAESEQKSLDLLNREIESLRREFLSKPLRDFLARRAAFEERRFELFPWFRFLGKMGRKVLGLSLSDPALQKDWPNLVRLAKLLRIESLVDWQQIDSEEQKFLSEMQQFLSPPLFQELKNVLEVSKNKIRPRLPQSPYAQVRFLLEKVVDSLPASYNFDRYPSLKIFIQLLVFREEIQSSALFEEMDRLSRDIENRMAKDARSRKIVQLLDDWRLLKRLLALELTPQAYEKLLKRSLLVHPSHFFERIKEIKNYKLPPTLDISRLDALFDKALEFYEGAKVRERWMAENISKLAEQSRNPVVVVTGGFHASGLKEYFRSQGLNFALVTPRIGEVGLRQGYIDSILGKRSALFVEAAALEDARFLPVPPDVLKRLGIDSEIEKQFRLETILKSGLPWQAKGKKLVREINQSRFVRDYRLQFGLAGSYVEIRDNSNDRTWFFDPALRKLSSGSALRSEVRTDVETSHAETILSFLKNQLRFEEVPKTAAEYRKWIDSFHNRRIITFAPDSIFMPAIPETLYRYDELFSRFNRFGNTAVSAHLLAGYVGLEGAPKPPTPAVQEFVAKKALILQGLFRGRHQNEGRVILPYPWVDPEMLAIIREWKHQEDYRDRQQRYFRKRLIPYVVQNFGLKLSDDEKSKLQKKVQEELEKILLPDSLRIFHYTSDYGDVKNWDNNFHELEAFIQTALNMQKKNTKIVIYTFLKAGRIYRDKNLLEWPIHDRLLGYLNEQHRNQRINFYDFQNPNRPIFLDPQNRTEVYVVNLPDLPSRTFNRLMISSHLATAAGDMGLRYLVTLAGQQIGPLMLFFPHLYSQDDMSLQFEEALVQGRRGRIVSQTSKAALTLLKKYFDLQNPEVHSTLEDYHDFQHALKHYLSQPEEARALRNAMGGLIQGHRNVFNYVHNIINALDRHPTLTLDHIRQDLERYQPPDNLSIIPLSLRNHLLVPVMQNITTGYGDASFFMQLLTSAVAGKTKIEGNIFVLLADNEESELQEGLRRYEIVAKGTTAALENLVFLVVTLGTEGRPELHFLRRSKDAPSIASLVEDLGSARSELRPDVPFSPSPPTHKFRSEVRSEEDEGEEETIELTPHPDAVQLGQRVMTDPWMEILFKFFPPFQDKMKGSLTSYAIAKRPSYSKEDYLQLLTENQNNEAWQPLFQSYQQLRKLWSTDELKMKIKIKSKNIAGKWLESKPLSLALPRMLEEISTLPPENPDRKVIQHILTKLEKEYGNIQTLNSLSEHLQNNNSLVQFLQFILDTEPSSRSEVRANPIEELSVRSDETIVRFARQVADKIILPKDIRLLDTVIGERVAVVAPAPSTEYFWGIISGQADSFFTGPVLDGVRSNFGLTKGPNTAFKGSVGFLVGSKIFEQFGAALVPLQKQLGDEVRFAVVASGTPEEISVLMQTVNSLNRGLPGERQILVYDNPFAAYNALYRKVSKVEGFGLEADSALLRRVLPDFQPWTQSQLNSFVSGISGLSELLREFSIQLRRALETAA